MTVSQMTPLLGMFASFHEFDATQSYTPLLPKRYEKNIGIVVKIEDIPQMHCCRIIVMMIADRRSND